MSISKPSNFLNKRVTTKRLQEMKDAGISISCLTAYDYTIAKILDNAGIDVILVGDSLGNVIQGHDTTISVSLEDTVYHSKAVVKGADRALVIADMPFMSYQVSTKEAIRNAGILMKETGCSAVKLEGGEMVADTISQLTKIGIPVMGHLGLTPQSINQFGSYKTRGKDKKEAEEIKKDALLLQESGVFAIVLEKIPATLGKEITESLDIPTIGIGAGPFCDGQILVYTDMLGLTVDFNPRFVRKYANLNETINDSVSKYIEDIRNGEFPNEEESY
ncbi:3-methyl-2-oxobutanoate hydroxymethyltransferase [Candidatus Kapabacteria bacterium]|nr:3-methyl-2-oxobutanoate hydroxymethyltransferase [Candidatus Kapabacteria bacterium]